MKPTLLVTLALLPCLAVAQTAASSTNQASVSAPTTNWHLHPPSPSKQLAWLTDKIGLTDTQADEIKPLLISRYKKLKAIYADINLTDDQKHTQAKALFDSTRQQIESFLTPAQISQYEEMHQQQHQPQSAVPMQHQYPPANH